MGMALYARRSATKCAASLRMAASMPNGVSALSPGLSRNSVPAAESVTYSVPSAAIASADPQWGASLLGDKAHSLVFDNSKLRSVVPGYRAVIPFEQGAREIVDWYDADPDRQQVDARLDAIMDKLVQAYGG